MSRHSKRKESVSFYEKIDSLYVKDDVGGVARFYKKYQVTDTCALVGDYLAGKEGTFGFWENENEVYPNESYYPNGNVRHFKFPLIKVKAFCLYTFILPTTHLE